MPPPRLFRHLRPHQSPWRIYQVRHISRTPRGHAHDAADGSTNASAARTPYEKKLRTPRKKLNKEGHVFRRLNLGAENSQRQSQTSDTSGAADIGHSEASVLVRGDKSDDFIRYTPKSVPAQYTREHSGNSEKEAQVPTQVEPDLQGSLRQKKSPNLPAGVLDGILEAGDSLSEVSRPFREHVAGSSVANERDAQSSKEVNERTAGSLSAINQQIERLTQQMRLLQDALDQQKPSKADIEDDATSTVAQERYQAEGLSASLAASQPQVNGVQERAAIPEHASLSKPESADISRPQSSTPEGSPIKPQESTPPSRKSERSLLEELFPETTKPPSLPPLEPRTQYPKLDLPSSGLRPQHLQFPKRKSFREEVVDAFRNRAEDITVLQLNHVSTHLVEADFRRLIPKGKHIETWARTNKAFYKVIPGRDPLSLERLPFYFLLFRTADAAYSYQNNVARIHKLAALHTSTSLFSAIPPPRGFLEDGEDLNELTTSYVLSPPGHSLHLNILMQPYNPSLRAIIERGGYTPIVPSQDAKGNPVFKVLLHISGHESTPQDLFRIFQRDAYAHGSTLPLRTESSASIHRLRDVVNLKTKHKHVASANPGAAYNAPTALPADRARSDRYAREMAEDIEYEDEAIQAYLSSSAPSTSKSSSTGSTAPLYPTVAKPPASDMTAREMSQLVMNRVYNRWMVEFADEDAAGRFARRWMRKALVDDGGRDGVLLGAAEERLVKAEVLW